MHEPNPSDEFTEVRVIIVRKETAEKARSQAIEVKQELPSFVSTCQFFGDVARGAVKRAGEIVECVCHSPAMLLPNVASKYSPVPCRSIVWPSTIYCSSPQTDH
jgi:hypothetical protein